MVKTSRLKVGNHGNWPSGSRPSQVNLRECDIFSDALKYKNNCGTDMTDKCFGKHCTQAMADLVVV